MSHISKQLKFRGGPHGTAFDYMTDFSLAGFPKMHTGPSAHPAEWSATGREYGQSFWYARRSALGPVACRCDLASDGIQADQFKRAFMRRCFSSVHFNENLAAIRH